MEKLREELADAEAARDRFVNGGPPPQTGNTHRVAAPGARAAPDAPAAGCAAVEIHDFDDLVGWYARARPCPGTHASARETHARE